MRKERALTQELKTVRATWPCWPALNFEGRIVIHADNNDAHPLTLFPLTAVRLHAIELIRSITADDEVERFHEVAPYALIATEAVVVGVKH